MGIFKSLFKPNIEKLKEQKDIKGLVDALSNTDSNIRINAAKALGVVGDNTSIDPLINALKDQAIHVQREAISALRKIGTPAVESLIITLSNEEWSMREKAAETLGEIGETRAAEPLIDALQDKNSIVRMAAVKALMKLQDSKIMEPLINVALGDTDSNVRNTAIDSIINLRTKVMSFIGRDSQISESVTISLRKMDEIIKAAEEIRKREDDEEFYLKESQTCIEKGDYDGGISYCNKELEINPESASAYYYRAFAYKKSGHMNEAVKSYREFIKHVKAHWGTVPYIGLAMETINEVERPNKESIQRLRKFLSNYIRNDNTPGGAYASDMKDYIACIFEVGNLKTDEAIAALKEVKSYPCYAEISLAVDLVFKRSKK